MVGQRIVKIAKRSRSTGRGSAIVGPRAPLHRPLTPLLLLAGAGVSTELAAQTPGEEASSQGLGFGVQYVGDALFNAKGGVSRGGEVLHNVDITLEFDEGVLGVDGLEAFAYLLANAGGSLVERVGDAQVASNIEAPRALRLYELWLQKSWGENLSLRVGLYDLNSEFDAAETGGLFLNSSHGIGPEYSSSGVTGPSIFPVTSLTARVDWRPSAGSYVRAAVLDGVPGDPNDERAFVHLDLGSDEGALVAVEVGSIDEEEGRTIALGGWSYTADFDDVVTGAAGRGAFGIYLFAESSVWSDGESGRNLSAYGRVGYANPSVHPVQWGLGGGLVLAMGRGDDQVGLGVAAAVPSSRYREAQGAGGNPVDRSEVSIEATYSLGITSWLRLQPNVQFVIDPGMNPALDNALVVGTRLDLGI